MVHDCDAEDLGPLVPEDPPFESIDVLNYLNLYYEAAVKTNQEDTLPEDPDRCTTIITTHGTRKRCSYAGIDRWEINGILIWNRCDDCLRERVQFHDFKFTKKRALSSGIVLHGNIQRFRTV